MRIGGRKQNIRSETFLGHKNIQTTMIYTQKSNTGKCNIISPIKDLNLNIDKKPDKFLVFVGI